MYRDTRITHYVTMGSLSLAVNALNDVVAVVQPIGDKLQRRKLERAIIDAGTLKSDRDIERQIREYTARKRAKAAYK